MNLHKNTPKKPRPSIIFDPVNPTDYRTLNIQYSCEQCSHFDPQNLSCTIGYPTRAHRREQQEKTYFLTGRMAICRFLEID